MIARPTPVSGTGIATIPVQPDRSRSCRAANRFAAASTGSPEGLRLRSTAAPEGASGPKESSASPGSGAPEPILSGQGGRVVARELTGRTGRIGIAGSRQRAGQGLDFLRRQPARTQQRGRLPAEVDDRRFDADGARPVVEQEVDRTAERIEDVLRAGGADRARGVRARRGDRAAGPFQERPRGRAAWRPHGESGQTGPGKPGNRAVRQTPQHEGKRARPEPLRQSLRLAGPFDQPPRGGDIRPRPVSDVDDQRVEFGAVFGREYARHRPVVGRIGAEPVNGFRRECDETAAPQDTGGFRNRSRFGRLPNRAHGR